MSQEQTGRTPDIKWVLWAGTIGFESSIATRVEAAHAGGYSGISVSPTDVRRAASEGTNPAELGRQLQDAGLEVFIDPLMTWYATPAADLGFEAASVEDMLRISESVHAVAIGAMGLPFNDPPADELAEPFARLCDRAAEIGAQVTLEFMPILPIADLISGWSIVRNADRPNGGLLFDSWHFFRSNPDFSLLEGIPGHRIFSVQIADGPEMVKGSLGEETFDRTMPGDGSFDLERILGVLDRIGALRCVGPEVISPVTAAMAPAEAARLTRGRIEGLIARARASSEADSQ
jgi:sugar phosphate isomerase/epimerase